MDFTAQAEHYLAAKKSMGLSDSSVKTYHDRLIPFGESIGKPAGSITANDVREYITHLMANKHYSPQTLQGFLSTIRCFFEWLRAEGVIDANPTERVKVAAGRKPVPERLLSPGQLERLRDACGNNRDSALLEFLYSTGCRVSEAYNINLADVDFTNRRVTLKGGRTLYFSARAKILLRQYLMERPAGEALFCHNRQPYERLSIEIIQANISNIGERAKIHRRVYPELLRRTLAADLANAGMDIRIIQSIMGYKSVNGARTYTGLNEIEIKREYDRVLK